MRVQETRRAGPFSNEPFVPSTAWPKPERIFRLLSDQRIYCGRPGSPWAANPEYRNPSLHSGTTSAILRYFPHGGHV